MMTSRWRRPYLRGKKLSTIAQELKLSLGTVKTYNQRIHRKLELSDQRELVLRVVGVYEQLRQAEGSDGPGWRDRHP